jgi:SP family sugar:H+ symporter-like MFS transporter
MNQMLGFHDFNLTLICSIALLVLSSFNYGVSDQAFASTQATNAFMKQFGYLDVKSNAYIIPTLYLSLLNSLKAGSQLFGEFRSDVWGNRLSVHVLI